MLAQLRRQGLTIRVEVDAGGSDERVVTFVKQSSKTTDKIRYYLEGGTVDE